MKIYTKTGDKGTTSLFGGSRIEKNSTKVEAYGTIDEVISFIGLARCEISNKELHNELFTIQKKLFNLGAELASDENGLKYLKDLICDEDIVYLEYLIDKYMDIVGPLKEFVIPGKNKSSSVLHVARTVVRRAERIIIYLNSEETVREELRTYVNRLSDTLFAMARYCEEN
ncbi:cob(I)yrinic acid a,c-diamide adenosyltransferase [Clostridium tarantellae]|uniref:Corrinoid adenosyltransferase n=1 Tax=Clostridium tarantellae TaxID=39493 RepID=A0A6I1MM83_9CLOT|nr:cob(I)yrinic acid a,c-diamide adenosyltransferase [Clostridium tarantellae]MPQ43352.1 cob(I)yrinic acid a,c-diamide adenosyltransferase [Clostridium tarantellae]